MNWKLTGARLLWRAITILLRPMTMHPVFFQKDVILARENLMEQALLWTMMMMGMGCAIRMRL